MPEQSSAPEDKESIGRFADWRSRSIAWFADRRHRLAESYRRNDIWFFVGTLAFAAVFVALWSNIVIPVHAGEAGVMWSRFFGTVEDRVYPEGTHLIVPWNKMTIYNVRYQKVDRTFSVLSQDGLDIEVEVTIRFRPEQREVGLLHTNVGQDYVETVIIPESYAAVRAVVNNYRPQELYAASFQRIQDAVTERARREVRPRYALIDDVQIRRITLPHILREAIQRKLEQEQAYLEMTHRIEREKQEAKRKEIEAGGIRAYNTTIANSLSTELLQYRGITATRELAQSDNAKVVVIGGQNGLPLILNADANTLAATPPAAAQLAAAEPPAAPPAPGQPLTSQPAPTQT